MSAVMGIHLDLVEERLRKEFESRDSGVGCILNNLVELQYRY